jgi:hypothetical protein
MGDDARVRSGSSAAGADLRFARPVGAIGTCEINGKHAPAALATDFSSRPAPSVGPRLLDGLRIARFWDAPEFVAALAPIPTS